MFSALQFRAIYLVYKINCNIFQLHPRTPHQCQVFWYNEVHPFLNKGKWTKEEDKLLLKLTEENSSGGNWDSIARELKVTRLHLKVETRHQHAGIYIYFQNNAVVFVNWQCIMMQNND